jgi:hypothetical protein
VVFVVAGRTLAANGGEGARGDQREREQAQVRARARAAAKMPSRAGPESHGRISLTKEVEEATSETRSKQEAA